MAEMAREKCQIEGTRARWDGRAQRYDQHYTTLRGVVEHYVDWELLQRYLPASKEARILDAAGGTGRITLPLAKMGYAVTLCDISPGMLEVARQKLAREGVLDRVEILECDVCQLRFPDESFDFALCWAGMLEAADELIRVTKHGGTISIYLVNRCRGAIDRFAQDPAGALALMHSGSDYVCDDGERYGAVSPEEARRWFEARGVRVLEIYAVCGWANLLQLPQELESGQWDEGFFRQAAEMVLRLSQEPAVKGMSRHLVVYGERV